MPTISLPKSRGWLLLAVNRLSPKASVLLVPEASILLWEGKPLAVDTGGCIYFPDVTLPGAAVRAMNAWKVMHPQVRLPIAQWDFTLGSALIRAGLQLTRQSKEEPANA